MMGVGFNMIIKTSFENFDDLYESGGLFPLYYSVYENIFYQEGGWVVCDILMYITPYELLLFKERKENMLIQDPRHNFLIGLFYPFK